MDYSSYFGEMQKVWLLAAYVMAISTCYWFLIQTEKKKK